MPASTPPSVTSWAGELITQLQLEVQELVARAEQADTREAKETLAIPAELARRETRIDALQQARQVIEARAKEIATAQQAEHQAKIAARQSQRAAGKNRADQNLNPRAKRPIPKRSITSPTPRAGSRKRATASILNKLTTRRRRSMK